MDVLPSHWQMVTGVAEEAMTNFLGGNIPLPVLVILLDKET